MTSTASNNSNGIAIELRLIQNAKTLKASAKVTFQTEIGEATASGFRIIEKDKDKPWVGFPQETYQKDGKWVNVPTLEFGPRGKRIIAEAILAEYQRVTGTTATTVSSRPTKGLTP